MYIYIYTYTVYTRMCYLVNIMHCWLLRTLAVLAFQHTMRMRNPLPNVGKRHTRSLFS